MRRHLLHRGLLVVHLACGALAAGGEPVVELSCAPGTLSTPIQAFGTSLWSYCLYLPPTFTTQRRWPVVFIMSPVGGGQWTLERYRPGAEECQWILAVSVESRNYFVYSTEAVEAMIADVRARLPIDPERVYVSGFSGGARMALRMAEERRPLPYAGVIACGAGRYPHTIGSDVAVYGLCGTTCFNRRDMALTFAGLRNPDVRLQFFVGAHDWAGPELLRDAMTWLNAAFLRAAATANTRYRREWAAFARKMVKEAHACATNRPVRAYELAQRAGGRPVTVPAQREALQLLARLGRLPGVRRHVVAQEALDVLVEQQLAAIGPRGGNPVSSNALRRAALTQADAHRATRYAEIFKELARPAPIPEGLLKRAVDSARQRGILR
jgi:hypothetical protein